jgi:membrane fusion protein (multidrug efflux system)
MPVNAMQVVVKDTPIIQEFIGEVVARQSIALRPQVSGQIVANLVEGGATVNQGQPLFRIDPRTYEAAVYSAQANLANSRAALNNTRLDVERFQSLAAQNAISRQQLDQILSTEEQLAAVVRANEALLRRAQNDLDDTLVKSPINGRIDIQDLSIGNFAQAGVTVLANISSTDPVHVQFSMSENNYLRLVNQRGTDTNIIYSHSLPLHITLGDGSVYPFEGRLVQVDKGLSGTTGTLSLRAELPNPQRILIPGMFARVTIVGEVIHGAVLIPQRAIQEILGKTFVTIVNDGGTADTRPVKLGPRYGSFQIVEEGLSATDVVIVEGFMKVRPGMPVATTMMQPEELNFPVAK